MVWHRKEAVRLLAGKRVLLLGGSIVRGIYKDLVWLVNSNTTLPREVRSVVCLDMRQAQRSERNICLSMMI